MWLFCYIIRFFFRRRENFGGKINFTINIYLFSKLWGIAIGYCGICVFGDEEEIVIGRGK